MRWLWRFVLLACVLGVPMSGYAYELLSVDFPFAIPEQARLSATRWIRLAVDVEEYLPATTEAAESRLVHAQALLPQLLLQVPDQPFRPYVGMGVGLSINTSFAGMALSPSLSRLQESLVMHVGGGFAYHVSEGVALVGGVRFARFNSTGLLNHLGLSSRDTADLDFSAYTVEFGLRMPIGQH